jgi:hypothetical protein
MASSNIPNLSTLDGSNLLRASEPFAPPKSTVPPPVDRSTKPVRPRQPSRQYLDSPFSDSLSQLDAKLVSDTSSSRPSHTSLDSSIRPGRQPRNGRPRSTISQGSSTEVMAILPIEPQATSARYRPPTEFEEFQQRENPFDAPTTAPQNMATFVTKMDVRPRYDPEAELKTAGKWRVCREKIYLTSALVAVK